MGFHQQSAAKALQQCRNHQGKAIEKLVSWGLSARALTPSISPIGTEPSSSDSSDIPRVAARIEGDSSSQLVTAASLLAQALQSDPAGQHLSRLFLGFENHVGCCQNVCYLRSIYTAANT